ncbi:MAG: radical SAM protein [Pirellulaceae bacterium]
MSRVVFVNPPNHLNDLDDLAPPLGLLVLMKIAADEGWTTELIDLALPMWANRGSEAESFYPIALKSILERDPILVCFTTMGVNSHVVLELGKQIKTTNPDVAVCVGGVHFSSIAYQLWEISPWLDFLVVGEGESALRKLLRKLSRDSKLSGNLEMVLSDERGDLNHPHAVYDQITLNHYFAANPRRVVNHETGRGCVFKCKFCYSPSHYTGTREAEIDDVASDWTKFVDLGFKHVFAVNDNFTNDPRHAIKLCQKIESLDLPLTWNGYATLPQLSFKVIEALARSKCDSIYLGIDAVTPEQREEFDKQFLRDEKKFLGKLEKLIDEGIHPTCAFILNLYDFKTDDVEATFEIAAKCAAIGASIRINSFTRYPGSFLEGGEAIARYSEAKMTMMFDCPNIVRQNELARRWPKAFPFHSTEISDEQIWTDRLRLIWIGQRLIQAYPDDILAFSPNNKNSLTAGLRKMVDMVNNLGLKEVLGNYFHLPATEVY